VYGSIVFGTYASTKRKGFDEVCAYDARGEASSGTATATEDGEAGYKLARKRDGRLLETNNLNYRSFYDYYS
jgi:hypothetical protein